MATALNLSGLTNCSPIFVIVIIGGVIAAVICGVLIVAVPVGMMCCLKHSKGEGAICYIL